MTCITVSSVCIGTAAKSGSELNRIDSIFIKFVHDTVLICATYLTSSGMGERWLPAIKRGRQLTSSANSFTTALHLPIFRDCWHSLPFLSHLCPCLGEGVWSKTKNIKWGIKKSNGRFPIEQGVFQQSRIEAAEELDLSQFPLRGH